MLAVVAVLTAATLLSLPEAGLSQSGGDVRLINNRGDVPTPYLGYISGRLEIYLFDSSTNFPNWGTVCSDGFDQTDADVACRNLGYQRATRFDQVENLGFVEPSISTPIWLNNVECSSSDTRLADCSRSSSSCTHDRDIALVCSSSATADPVRLISETGRTAALNAGRLEIFINGQWGTVCDDAFGSSDANVACRQLGFPSGAISYTNAGALASYNLASSSVRTWLDNLGCISSSTDLRSCSHAGIGNENCAHSEDVVLSCLGEGSVRLVSSSNNFSTTFSGFGRLEVYSGGRWGTVCDDGFSNTNAEVVCEQLSFSFANTWSNLGTLSSAPSSTPILLDNVDCSSTDLTLLSCNYPGIGVHNCGHSEDVAVYCSTYSPSSGGGGGGGGGGSTINIGGIAGGVVSTGIFLLFVCIPICICVCIASNSRNTTRRSCVTTARPAQAVVATTTTTTTTAAQPFPQQASAPYPAAYPVQQQQAPPPPAPTGVLQQAAPPSYDAATAYPPPVQQPYPPQGGRPYPPQGGGQPYPPQGGPPQGGGQPYPPQGGQPYPPQPYPPQDQAYPAANPAYPPAVGGPVPGYPSEQPSAPPPV